MHEIIIHCHAWHVQANAAAKAAMGLEFEQNRLKPGDAGYDYDVRADFASPSQDNDWDDSGAESSDFDMGEGEEEDNTLLDFLREENAATRANKLTAAGAGPAVVKPVVAAVAAVASSAVSLQSPPKQAGRRMPSLA